MAEAFFDPTVDFSELEELVESMGDRVTAGMSQTMATIADMLVTAVSDRYDTTGDGQWPPNAPSTIKKKGSSKPMIDNSILANSTEAKSGKDFAEASTGVAYVVFHLEGGPVIPKRNPFELADEALDEVEDFYVEEVMKILAKG